ncbi:MAG: amidohydrolase family protein [Actinobacteria bacterium]|nr:amidohydrolase family protein [Actinomycetota bacterium]
MRTIYRARIVRTLGYPATGEWILVDDRHVQRVGVGEPPPADRTVALPGATILPGFVDAHVHLTGTGMTLGNEELERVRSAGELVALAERRSAKGAVTLLAGFDETRWDDPALPTIEALDEIGPGPLLIRRVDGHTALANTAALRAADVLGLAGVERDVAGEPTGRVTQEANARLSRWAALTLSDQEVQQLQLAAAALAAARGVTTIHEMSMPYELGLRDLEVFLGHRDQLPVDSTPVVATMDIPQVMDLRLAAIGGDLPVDGSIGARTAALLAPYADGDGEGACYYEDDELAQFFHAGHAAGLQVGVHAIGDRAIEQVLSAWERVYSSLGSRGKRHFRARRHRIEHFEMASADHVERAAMLGLAISVQPAFDARWGQAEGLYEIGVDEHRAAAMNPFRTVLQRGLELGAGSDSPVTPLDPMLGIDAFEHHHDPAQRLSRQEAIRAWTNGGARLAHLEDKKGALEPGMHADFAAYDTDPMETDSVLGLRPILTVSLGRDVFAA